VTREETIRAVFDAFNRRDVDAVIEHFDEDVEAIPLRAAVEDISYRGHSGIRQFLAENAAIWHGFAVRIEEVRQVAESFVALGRMEGEGRVSGVKTEGVGAWVIRFRGDRISYYRTYADRDQAIADAEQRQP
jgi:ketosteroid isomerase-like protein